MARSAVENLVLFVERDGRIGVGDSPKSREDKVGRIVYKVLG